MVSTTIEFVDVVDVVNDVVMEFFKEEFIVKLHETLDNFVNDNDDDGYDVIVCLCEGVVVVVGGISSKGLTITLPQLVPPAAAITAVVL